MLVRLRQDELESHLHPTEVEERVAAGLVDPTAELAFPPWTGDGWAAAGAVSALAQAWSQPRARLALRLREHQFPVGITLVVLVMAGLTAAQLLLGIGASEVGLGFGPMVLEGRWWAGWSAHSVHLRPLHFVGNLLVLAYAGYRCERVLGSGGLAVVLGAAAAVGALFVVGLGEGVVVGASMLAYGAWGAQMMLGVRFDTAIPARLRRFYGAGSFLVFVPLFPLGLSAPGVSHLGHLGGLAGGVLAALFVAPETLSPVAGQTSRLRRNLVSGASFSAFPAVFALILARSPALSGWPWVTLAVPGSEGWELTLPGRYALHPGDLGELRSWHADTGDEAGIFAGAFVLAHGQVLDASRLSSDWHARLGRVVTATAEPREEEGWSYWTFEAPATMVDPPLLIAEWTYRAPGRLYRCGWLVPLPVAAARLGVSEEFADRCRRCPISP